MSKLPALKSREKGTIRNIIEQAGLTVEEVIALLK